MTEAELLQSYFQPRHSPRVGGPRHRVWIVSVIPAIIAGTIIGLCAVHYAFPLWIFAAAALVGLPLGALVLLLPAGLSSAQSTWRTRLPRFIGMGIFGACVNASIDGVTSMILPPHAPNVVFHLLVFGSLMTGTYVTMIVWLWRRYTSSEF